MRLSALPPFRSLLIHGAYVPSAPIHLCLSIPPPDNAILLTPSRNSLLQALRSHRDDWLTVHSGTGTVASVSSRVTLFYPSSLKHLIAVLAMLRIHDISSESIPAAPNVTLDRAPTMLVLHEPSAYFLAQQELPLSSYLLLITYALSTIEYLSSQSFNLPPTRLVVFDTQLDRLKLPILRAPHSTAFEVHDSSEDVPRPESVLFFVEKYFELSGTFQSHGQTESDPETMSALVLRRLGENLVEEKIQKSEENIK